MPGFRVWHFCLRSATKGGEARTFCAAHFPTPNFPTPNLPCRPLQERFPRLNQDQALQEQAFATAVQSGVGGATRLLRRAGFDRDDRSSQELIANLTAARTHAYRRNAGRYAAEGQDIEALNQNNHLKKFDRGAFANFV